MDSLTTTDETNPRGRRTELSAKPPAVLSTPDRNSADTQFLLSAAPGGNSVPVATSSFRQPLTRYHLVRPGRTVSHNPPQQSDFCRIENYISNASPLNFAE